MNVSIETDDTNNVLRQQAYNMLAQLKASVQKLLENGVKNEQVRSDVDLPMYTTIVIATLEGGIMMSKLERNNTAIDQTIAHLRNLVADISV